MPENWQEAGFGIYVHWPFCAAKCPYCDFNSHVSKSVDQTRWARAFRLATGQLGRDAPGRVVTSIYFGGGTPSLMRPDLVAEVLEAIGSEWVLANDVEITLEANPGSVEAGRFRGYRDAGVNRVSIGFQALRDTDLRRLGRLHSVAEGWAALEVARSVFDRVSFDLIYARQDQKVADWRAELGEAIDRAGDHLSLYQLTIEPGTVFGERFAKGRFQGLPDSDLGADLYEVTQEICGAAGLPAYEVSNHARPGSEARHNLIYWRDGDWGGIGPGAHGRLTRHGQRYGTEAVRMPGDWLDAAERGEAYASHAIPVEEWMEERLMMGLRTREGVPMARLDRTALLPEFQNNIRVLEDEGLIETQDGILRATERGLPVLNHLLLRLLT